jgi:hypothetical protein
VKASALKASISAAVYFSEIESADVIELEVGAAVAPKLNAPKLAPFCEPNRPPLGCVVDCVLAVLVAGCELNLNMPPVFSPSVDDPSD